MVVSTRSIIIDLVMERLYHGVHCPIRIRSGAPSASTWRTSQSIWRWG